jgi:hypothetical protein
MSINCRDIGGDFSLKSIESIVLDYFCPKRRDIKLFTSQIPVASPRWRIFRPSFFLTSISITILQKGNRAIKKPTVVLLNYLKLWKSAMTRSCRLDLNPVPEIIDPVFAKTSQNARFLLKVLTDHSN